MSDLIPVIHDVDVLVVGGNSGAVAAAVAAARKGKKVFLISERLYLGDDICARLNLLPQRPEKITSELAREILAPETLCPLQVKERLERALYQAGVSFLFGSFPCAVLRDETGKTAGIIMANRSGRQAVKAPWVVDSTWRAQLARLAGVPFCSYPSGTQVFEYKRLGGNSGEKLGELTWQGQNIGLFRYCQELDMPDNGWTSFARAEQELVLASWDPQQEMGSDGIFQLPPDPVQPGPFHQEEWVGAENLPLESLACGDDRLFILSACADFSRSAAEAFIRPANSMAVGERLGEFLGNQKAAIIGCLQAQNVKAEKVESGVMRTALGLPGMPADLATVAVPENSVPVLGSYDVVVAGGGTGGAPAGIAAARQGAKTLVLEQQFALGGISTVGLIGCYWFGNQVGFTHEIDKGVAALGQKRSYVSNNRKWNVEGKKFWFCRELWKAGGELWTGTVAVGAWVVENQVCGVVVAGPHGYGLVKTKVVVDATGCADIPAAAGAPCVQIGAEHVAVQGCGLPPRNPGADTINTDYTFVDDTDIADVTQALVCAKRKFPDAFDLTSFIDSRERRRIQGDFQLSIKDLLSGRHYRDTICIARSDFDTHGFTVHPLFMIQPPNSEPLQAHVPFRCLLPQNLEGVLVTGLGVSAHRDALPVIRMQPDVQNQGYAAGVAAARAAQNNLLLRELDIRALQRHLIEIEILPPEILSDEDVSSWDDENLQTAIKEGCRGLKNVAIVFSAEKKAVGLLRSALQAETDQARCLHYAEVLALLGDDTGAEILISGLQTCDWDEGWNYRGMGQAGLSFSPVDALVVAVGRLGTAEALNTVLEKGKTVGDDPAFSHCRALSLALSELNPIDKDYRIPELLSNLLDRPNMGSHAQTCLGEALNAVTPDPCENNVRNRALRELVLARALYYSGDLQGRGQAILEHYAQDVRGHFARHARAILATGA